MKKSLLEERSTRLRRNLKLFFKHVSANQPDASFAKRYAVAAISVLVAFGLRYILDPFVGQQVPYTPFVPAIIVVAWYSGLVPSILASLASLALAAYFFLASPSEVIAAAVYLFSLVAVVALANALRDRAQMLEREMEERRRIEHELRDSEERFRKIFEFAAVGITQVDATGHIMNANPTFCDMVGYSLEELQQRTFLDITFPEDREKGVEYLQQVASHRVSIYEQEKRYITKEGKVIWARVTASFLLDAKGSPNVSIGIIQNISARKKAEEQLHQSQKTLRAIVDHSPTMIFLKDLEGRYLLSNLEFEQITHRPAAEVAGKTDQELFPPKQADAFRTNDLSVIKSGIALEFEETALHDDGLHTSIVHKFPLHDANGNVSAVGGIVTDITVRKAAEEALRKSEQRYAHLVNSIDGIVWEANPNDFMFSFVSEEAVRLLLYPLDRWLSEPEFWRDHLDPEDRDEAVKGCIEAIAKRQKHELEYRMIAADGHAVWLRDIVNVVIENGNVVKLRGVMVDITARKIAEEKLREHQQMLDAIVNNPTTLIFVKDSTGHYVFNNGRQWAEHLHIPEDSVTGRNDLDLFGPDLAATFQSEDKQVLASGREMTVESKMQFEDGCHTFFVIKCPLCDKNGKPYAICGIATDITERKRTEEALRHSEELLRMATEAAGVTAWKWDMVHDALDCPKAHEELGLPPEVTINLEMYLSFAHPDDRVWLKKELHRCLAESGQLNVEFRTVLPDGSIRWRQSLGRPICTDGKVVAISGISMDITERKQAEQRLQRSEERLRLSTEFTGVGLWDWNLRTDTLEWTPIVNQQLGLPQDTETNYSTFLACVHPEDRNRVDGLVLYSLQTSAPYDTEYRAVWPDHSIHWMRTKAHPILDDHGLAIRFVGITMDVTEEKHAEEALRRQAELLNLTQVLVCDLDMTILSWSRGAEKLYGWSKEEAIGKTSSQLLSTVFPEPFPQVKEKLFRLGHWEGELSHIRKDGKKVAIASQWVLYKDPQNRAVAILESNNDITELKQAEASLQQARDTLAKHAEELEKRVADRTAELQVAAKDMERFCYSIAHDLRAPLRAMRGFAQALLEDYSSQFDDTGRVFCERIDGASHRMDQLISDLLAYGRLSHIKAPVEEVNLMDEVQKVLADASYQIQEKHATVKVDSPLPSVYGDPKLLDQVLNNLVNNAVKFVPSERAPEVHIYAEQHDDNVRLWIEDNGIGIAPEHRQRIFAPFQRLHTHEYPGTGIGLAIVQRGVEKMSGHVGVESEPGKGSRFWIELPKT